MKQPLEYNPRQSIRRSVVILAVVIAVFCLFIVTVLFVPLLLDSSSSGVKVSLFHRSPLDDYLSGTVTEISLGADPSNGFRSVCQSEEEMDEAIDKLFKLKLAKRDETVEMTDAFVMDVQCGNAKQVSLFFSLDGHLRVESSTNTSEVSYFQGNTKAIQEYLTFLLSLMKGDSGDDSPLRAYQPERIVSAKIRQ